MAPKLSYFNHAILMITGYTPKYKARLYLFFNRVMQEMGYDFIPDSKDLDITQVESMYLVPNGCFLLKIIENEVVGSIGIRVLSTGKAELKRFYVLREYQGIGIGLNLLKSAIEHTRKTGFSSLRLDTTSNSLRAIKIFQEHGFQKIEKYNDDPYAELYMELKL